jgi:hypothetical protein
MNRGNKGEVLNPLEGIFVYKLNFVPAQPGQRTL